MAQRAMGVVRVAETPLLVSLSESRRTTPQQPLAAVSPPYPRRGAQFPSFATETS
jgi:hypothetical protein